ncbi:TadE/TadG family type IV pilus assembly protein [Microbispora rosea]|uniref:TadE/TadG family type IV pilus assembly protein n=1 Tax=Microbispora rosea TaxID=58117 RepID=UPI0009E0AFB8|nr:TadE/TadG family type IV pilus assembly protein [Microbispora rosea]
MDILWSYIWLNTAFLRRYSCWPSPSQPRSRRWSTTTWGKSSDRGSAPLEAAILYPVVLTLTLLLVNAALWLHACNVALAAAQEGVRVARAYGSNLSASTLVAERFAQRVGGSFLISAHATAGRTGGTVSVTVQGEALTLVPLLKLTVSQIAHAPIERWSTPTR